MAPVFAPIVPLGSSRNDAAETPHEVRGEPIHLGLDHSCGRLEEALGQIIQARHPPFAARLVRRRAGANILGAGRVITPLVLPGTLQAQCPRRSSERRPLTGEGLGEPGRPGGGLVEAQHQMPLTGHEERGDVQAGGSGSSSGSACLSSPHKVVEPTAILATAVSSGKFHGVIAATGPTGRRSTFTALR